MNDQATIEEVKLGLTNTFQALNELYAAVQKGNMSEPLWADIAQAYAYTRMDVNKLSSLVETYDDGQRGATRRQHHSA